jgi:hypothetical protein
MEGYIRFIEVRSMGTLYPLVNNAAVRVENH